MKPNQYGKLKALSRLARESPFKGERQAAEAAIKRLEKSADAKKRYAAEDPRLSRQQAETIEILRMAGFRVTYEFGVDIRTAAALEDLPTSSL